MFQHMKDQSEAEIGNHSVYYFLMCVDGQNYWLVVIASTLLIVERLYINSAYRFRSRL